MKNGWQIKTLDQFSTNLDSRRIPITKDIRKGGEYPYYGASGIVDYVADYIFDEDALLISEDGANLLARSTPIAFPASGKYWVNNHAHILRFANITTQRFVELYFESISIVDYVTGAAQPKLTQKALNSIPIPLPPLAEQQRIVSMLGEAFEKIATAKANAEKNLQNARALFESHLSDVFTKEGKAWVDTTIGKQITLLTGFAFKSKRYTVAEKDVRLLGGDNILQGFLRWESERRWPVDEAHLYEKFFLCEGDVVLAMDRPWVKSGLKCAQLVKEDLPCLLIQRTACLRGGKNLNSRLLYYLICSNAFVKHILGVQTGSGVPHISGHQILSFAFFLPSLSEQASIVATLDSLSAETQCLEAIYRQKLAALEALKKSLLDQAFSGGL